jgi:alpha-galactosidase
MNLDPAQLEAQAIGVNHFVFFTTLRYQGKDAYPLLAEFLEQRMPEIWETEQWKSRLDIDGPATREMFRIFGLYPCNGDAHMSEFVPWFTADEHDVNTFKMKMDYADRYIAGGTAEVARLSRLATDQTASVSEFFAGHSHEKAIDIVECLLTGRSRIFHVITANHGSISNLPWDAAVEIPANIGSDRVQGLNMGSLPIGLRNFVRRNLDQDELFMEATVQKDLRLLFQAWLGDHYTHSMTQARAYWDEWLAGHHEDIAGWTDFDSRNAQ